MFEWTHVERTDRRGFVRQAATLASAVAVAGVSRTANAASLLADQTAGVTEKQIREYLKTILPTRQDIDLWLAGKAFPFGKYDAELGYLHLDRDFREGQNGAICQYRYDPSGSRRMIAYADRPCRINTYGDSFTSCEQVSDSETWQEALAAHLGEPLRNYGIGGYSVYQAYLRMLREERRNPAAYIIFNIFDDDHARNLHGWQRFKFGVNKKSTNPTVPHVRVDLQARRIIDRSNPCPTPQSVYNLCDLERVFSMFHDDYYLRNRLNRTLRQRRGEQVPAGDYDDKDLIRHGIFATESIIERVQEFARTNGKRVLYVLSSGAYTIKQFIETGRRFDQELVDYLDRSKLSYIDLMRAHAADAARFKGSTDEALARYFIGHYNPLGNDFCAFAIKDALVQLLNPKPPAYAPGGKS